MIRTTLLLASLMLATLGLPARAASIQEDTHGAAAKVASTDDPHARAPGQLDSLVISGDTWLRAAGEDWFTAQAEAGATRFTESDEACQLTEDGQGTGEYEAGWVDALGEYELRYDEDEDEFAYWQHVSAATLTRGRQAFVQFCSSCHGFDGDGNGRSGQHLRPPPRNFQQNTFKFTKVISDYVPSDAALLRLVRRGLNGTPMLPWDLGDKQLHDIIQYVKSLSPPGRGWRDVYTEIADVVDIGEDPFASNPQQGVAKGREVYHRIGCYNCHPGYVSTGEINRILEKDPDTSYRDDLTYPKATKSSAFDVRGHFVQILPPDFTFHTIRSGWAARDVAETVAAGIGGAGMPQWKGSISDEEIWAIGHYVRSLIDEYKDQPAKRAAFMGGLRHGN